MFAEWACRRCGEAFFGCPPSCGLCITCQDETGLIPAAIPAGRSGVSGDDR
jgi:hypothetical protein